MTLIGLTRLFNIDPKGLPHFTSIDLRSSHHALSGWRILMKGPRIVFVGPAEKPGGPSKIVVAPRAQFVETWEGAEADLKEIESWAPGADGAGREKR